MSAPAVPSSSAPPEWLSALLELLVAAEDRPGPDPAATILLRFEFDDDGGITVGRRPLEVGDHPVPTLLGFVAPDEWHAFGVLAPGWASRYSPGPQSADWVRNRVRRRPSTDPERVRTRSAHVVSRQGTEVGILEIEGEPPHVTGPCRATDPEAPTGAVPDILRRTMGVATPPPAFPPAELLAAAWLTSVIAAGPARGRRRLSLDGAVAAAPDRFDAALLAAAHPDGIGWSTLRWSAVEGAPLFGVDPTLAAWFDDGAFARWAISNYLPLDDLVSRVRKVTTAATYRDITAMLHEWGLDW